MKFKIGQTVKSNGLPGTYKIIADRQHPYKYSNSPSKFREVVKNCDYLLKRIDVEETLFHDVPEMTLSSI